MPPVIAAFLMTLGCAPATFNGPAGPFAVWVCPPVQGEPAEAEPAPKAAPKPDEVPS